MSEIKQIVKDIKAAYLLLNDQGEKLSRVLSDRRINSGNSGAEKFMSDMTSQVDSDQKPLAINLLAGLIGRKKLIDDTKKKK